MDNYHTIKNKICCGSAAVQCVNPLTYIFGEVFARAKKNNISPEIPLGRILSTGLILSNNGKFCCPDCTDRYGFYYLGNIPNWNIISELLKFNTSSESCAFPCCVNVEATVETYPDYADNMPIIPPCCDTGFIEGIFRLLQTVSSGDFASDGIVEASSIEGKSMISPIMDELYKNNPFISAPEIGAVFEAIMTLGIAIKCFDCSIIVAGTEVFTGWLADNGYDDKICE